MTRFLNKVVIVTGGSQGIGEGCVRVFVANGAKVVACALGDHDGDELVKELNQKGPGECCYRQCDVRVEAEIIGLIEFAVLKYGRLDCIINNAGWHPPGLTIDDFSVDDFKKLLDLNLVSCFAMSKHGLPHIRKTSGSIVNIASLVATMGQLNATTYVASKGGVVAFSKALAIDEAQYGVRVNSISPGNVLTPLWQSWANTTTDPEGAIQMGNDQQLLGRMATPLEIGEACLFLASEGTFCTGIDLVVSAGAELSYGNKNRVKVP